MAGITGILKSGKKKLVSKMLEKISHRGKYGSKIFETAEFTIGVNYSSLQNNYAFETNKNIYVQDYAGNGHFAKAGIINGQFLIERDELGIAPLYYGKTSSDELCFASEVKSLLIATNDLNEFPPGNSFIGNKIIPYFKLQKAEEINYNYELIATKLRNLLDEAVSARISSDLFGSWLSGGLDSSTIAAIARPYVGTLHTFSAGLKDAPDLQYASVVANHIKSNHHEIIVELDEMVKKLPEVIYHLESFDALLVRSSVVNFIAAKAASDYVSEIFSGEGGDELFAGYEYIKTLQPESIPDELIDITSRLHNTAFQRVDRSASAHGTVPHLVFADPNVFNYALSIPSKYKLNNGIEKWILRQAVKDLLPTSVLNRNKAKFWEGAGVQELISEYASEKISDNDFQKERYLPNGWKLISKEELYYYRIFREYFGEAENFNWMGRTKGASN